MRSDSPEKVMVCMDFKGKTIKHIDAGLPAVLISPHLFDPERRVFYVLQEKP
ncbi:MAG: hypothetical protein HZA15_12240 [Nitrospirae bacterium]|nr:hypothetical protein [Nitrospirota bacterium]